MVKYNSENFHPFSFLLLFAIAIVFLPPDGFAAEGQAKQPAQEADTPIHIISDRLFIDNDQNSAEFKGNVQATQNDTIIYSDILQIIYTKEASQSGELPDNEQSIQKIIATGNVKIHFDDRLAEADKAVYTAETRILELTGKLCKITTEKNKITGEKIIFHRDDGRIFVESGKETKRVEALISSDGKAGLD